MMQPILDYRAEEALKTITTALKSVSEDVLYGIAVDVFAIDVDEPTIDEHGKLVLFDREDAEIMIEGRLLDAFARSGLAKFSYVDYDWAKAEGLVS